jgi:hypothetical protein
MSFDPDSSQGSTEDFCTITITGLLSDLRREWYRVCVPFAHAGHDSKCHSVCTPVEIPVMASSFSEPTVSTNECGKIGEPRWAGVETLLPSAGSTARIRSCSIDPPKIYLFPWKSICR